MVASRLAAGQTELSATEIRKSLTYALAVITSAVSDNGIPHAWLKFPDFLHDPARSTTCCASRARWSATRFTEVATTAVRSRQGSRLAGPHRLRPL